LSLISTRLALVCLTLPITAALSAQSLGDRQEGPGAARQDRSTPTKTYTNESLTKDPRERQTTEPAVAKTTVLPMAQAGKQFMTLFDVRIVGNGGGVKQTLMISGRGYAGTLAARRQAGLSDPGEDEFVWVIIADSKDPAASYYAPLHPGWHGLPAAGAQSNRPSAPRTRGRHGRRPANDRRSCDRCGSATRS
jgi:hypothetical protein